MLWKKILISFSLGFFLFTMLYLYEVTGFLQSPKDFTPYSDNTNTGQYGMMFNMTGNYTLVNVTLAPGISSSHVCLYQYSPWVNLTCVQLAGQFGEFRVNNRLNKSVMYVVWANKEGGIQTTKYNGSTGIYPIYPVEATKALFWITGLSLGTTYPVNTSGTNSSFWLGHISYGLESICTSSFSNTSYSDWQNKTECSIIDLVSQNRSYITTDLNHCIANVTHYENQNVSCNYCLGRYQNTSVCQNINTSFDSIDSMAELTLLSAVLLYGIFLLMGYWLIKSGNLVLGYCFYFISIGFDFLFTGIFYNTYKEYLHLATTGIFVYIFMFFLILLILLKFIGLALLQIRKL